MMFSMQFDNELVFFFCFFFFFFFFFAPQNDLIGPFIDVKHSITPWFCVYCWTRYSCAIKEAREQMMS